MDEGELLSPRMIIGNRYLIVDLIGKGGFGAVYLVQDQWRENGLFALKEVFVTTEEARERFAFEAGILERLAHPALPRVHHVFDNGAHNRLYMLMDYVEGPNLDMLRRIQPGRRFSFSIIIAVLAPIVDALEYLHKQNPPIIHRDIKPANIIVPIAGGTTILADFGIAKEYNTRRATSAVRYGSPGYGAPEHYSSGTNVRSDIYGLGATLYTLLTGEVPIDALDRMLQFSNENSDPLKPVHEIVPTIPLSISRAIQRAMALRTAQRFPTVRAFWQALQVQPEHQAPFSEAINSIVASSPSYEASETSPRVSQVVQWPDNLLRKRFLLPVFLVSLIIVGIAVGYWRFTATGGNPFATTTGNSTSNVHHIATTPTTRPSAVNTVTSTPGVYIRLAPSYNGTINDLQANVSSQATLTQMQQNGEHISGSFNSTRVSAPYSGFLDTSKHIYFTIPASENRAPLYFSGIVQANGNLTGTFCEIDQGGQCISNGVFGLWNVAPEKQIKQSGSLDSRDWLTRRHQQL